MKRKPNLCARVKQYICLGDSYSQDKYIAMKSCQYYKAYKSSCKFARQEGIDIYCECEKAITAIERKKP